MTQPLPYVDNEFVQTTSLETILETDDAEIRFFCRSRFKISW